MDNKILIQLFVDRIMDKDNVITLDDIKNIELKTQVEELLNEQNDSKNQNR